MKRNYFYFVLVLLFLLFLNCESTGQKKKSDNYSSNSKYNINNLSEVDYLEPSWSNDKSTLITVFKYTVDKNSKDWAMVFMYGVALLYKKVNSMDTILAVGIIYNDGTQKGYYVIARDLRDLSNNTITADQFSERVFVKDF